MDEKDDDLPGIDDLPDLPPVRPVAEVISEMRSIAAMCAHTAEATSADPFHRALSLILELRVPRMPETREELAEMLATRNDGPALDSEETFRQLRIHSAQFEAFLDQYRGALKRKNWEGAVALLAPPGNTGAPQWRGPASTISTNRAENDITATIEHGDAQVHCTSRCMSLAMLGAIMTAHAEWPSIRRY